MIEELFACGIPIIVIGIPLLLMTVRIVNEWERGVILTLGRFSRKVTPGLNIIIPVIENLIKVDTRITTIDIPKQEVMTRDNVPVMVNAVVYMRVEDAVKAILKIDNYRYAVAQYAQTALRDVIGEIELDSLLTKREGIAKQIKAIVDTETDEWGVDITNIKLQDVELPANMKRVMARQAEAEREKRATIILSTGEVAAADNLAKAAKILGAHPASLQLRTLQTITDISADPNSKIIIALPVEILKYFEAATKGKK
ncbi:MAG: slipin family protein [Candidatus Micrarchaeota archaeon]